MFTIPPIQVKRTNVQPFIQKLEDIADTCDQGVRVGVIGSDVTEEKARNSWALEHRYQGAGPSHWDKGTEYVRWAFATRTAKYLEDKVLPDVVQSQLDQGVTGREFWDQIGNIAVMRMRAIMAGVSMPRNAPSTIRQSPYKTGSNPLIASGEMKRSVDFQVEDVDDLEEASDTSSGKIPAF